MTPEPALSLAVTSFMRRYSETIAAVFTPAVGVEVRVAGDPRPGPGTGGERFVFAVAGACRGTLAVALEAADAVFLARQFTGVPAEGASEPSSEDREALDELWRQAMGQFTAILRSSLGEMRFELSAQGAAAPEAAFSAVLGLTRDGQPLPITVELDRELAESLSSSTASADSRSSAAPADSAASAASGAEAPGPHPSSPGLSNLRAENLELLLNVELPATIRFGQKHMRLSEILQLTAGAVIDLDREVQEPVELLVDGRLIARGEAVIVDGNYGLRITELASPSVRLAAFS